MTSALLVTDVSFTGFNVQFDGDSFNPDYNILIMEDGPTPHPRNVTTQEAITLMNKEKLLVSFDSFGLSYFKLGTQYPLSLKNTEGGLDTTIAIGNVLLQSSVGIPTDLTTTTGKVTLRECSGCTALYYGKTSELAVTVTTINISPVPYNEEYPVDITFSPSLEPGVEYTLWTDTQGGLTLGSEGAAKVMFNGPTPLGLASISQALINNDNSGVETTFINCNGLDNAYKVYIGEDDGSGTALNKTLWGFPISTINTADFARLLYWSDFSGFIFTLGKTYILWIDNTGGNTYGAPGSNAIARIIPAKVEPSAIYFVNLSAGSTTFRGQITVNNATNTITSFADVNDLPTNLLRSGGANNLPGKNNPASNSFKKEANGLFFGEANTNPDTNIIFWTYINITGNATLQTIANSIGSNYDSMALYNDKNKKNSWIVFQSGKSRYGSGPTDVILNSGTETEKSINVLTRDATQVKLKFINCSGLTGQYLFTNIQMSSGSPPYLAYKYGISAFDLITSDDQTLTLNWGEFNVGGMLSVNEGDSLSIYINTIAANPNIDTVTVSVNTIIPVTSPILQGLYAHDLTVTNFQLDYTNYTNNYTSSTNDKITVGTTTNPDKSDSYIATGTIVGPVDNQPYNFSGFTVPKPSIVGNQDYTVGLWTNYGTVLNNTVSMRFTASIAVSKATTTGADVTFTGCTGLQAAGYKLWVTTDFTTPKPFNSWDSSATTLTWSNFTDGTPFSPSVDDNCIIFIDMDGLNENPIARGTFKIGTGSPSEAEIGLGGYTPNSLFISLTNSQTSDTVSFQNIGGNQNQVSRIVTTSMNGKTAISLTTFENFIGLRSGFEYTLVLNNGTNKPSVTFSLPQAIIEASNADRGGVYLTCTQCINLSADIYSVSIKNKITDNIYPWSNNPDALPTASTYVSWDTFGIEPQVGDTYIIFIDNDKTNTNSFVSSNEFVITSSPPPVVPKISVSKIGLYGFRITYSNYTSSSSDSLLITGTPKISTYNIVNPIVASTEDITGDYVFSDFIDKFTPVVGKYYVLTLNAGSASHSVRFTLASIVLGGPVTLQTTSTYTLQNTGTATLQNTGTITFNGCIGLAELGYSLRVKVVGSTTAYTWSQTLATINTDPYTIVDGINWAEFTGFSPSPGDRCYIYISQSNSTADAFAITTVTIPSPPSPPGPVPCFRAGTLILCDISGTETYLPIESLKPGVRVKTSSHGFVPIDMIGYTTLKNPGHADRIQNRLYKCSTTNYPELTKDLYITGCHSILVDDLTETQKQATLTQLKDIFVTKGKYRLMACIDERAEPYIDDADYPIWHIALENTEYYQNYGIWANGLLVETCSKRYLKELSGMTLVL